MTERRVMPRQAFIVISGEITNGCGGYVDNAVFIPGSDHWLELANEELAEYFYEEV